MEIGGPSIPVRSDDVVFRTLEDEAIFVPIRRSASDLQSIYTTNSVGIRVWELIDGSRSVDSIVAEIAAEYEVSSEDARRDVAEYLEQLRAAGCVHV